MKLKFHNGILSARLLETTAPVSRCRSRVDRRYHKCVFYSLRYNEK